MSYDEILSGKISLIKAFKLSFEIFKKSFPKLVILLMLLVVPVNLIHKFGLNILTADNNLTPNLQASANVGLAILMNPVFILVNLALLSLLYSIIKNDDGNVINAVLIALKKWVKSILTTILALLIILGPVLVIAILASVIIPSIQSGSELKPATILLIIFLSITGAATIPYMLYFGINYIFFPLAVLVTDKWGMQSLTYSKRLVKGNWWFCLLLMMIFVLVPVVFVYLSRLVSATILMETLTVIIVSVMSAFLILPYIIYYLNFEQLKKTTLE